jgi:hypothetical protein
MDAGFCGWCSYVLERSTATQFKKRMNNADFYPFFSFLVVIVRPRCATPLAIVLPDAVIFMRRHALKVRSFQSNKIPVDHYYSIV